MNSIGKEKSEKLMIISGDVHVACLPHKPTAAFADTIEFIFGDVLLRDHPEYPYLNLTLLPGTKEDLLKEKDTMAGWQFYISQHEDENFKIGDAKLTVIRDENQHRILFIFNTPVTGKNVENVFLANKLTATQNNKVSVFNRWWKGDR